MVSIKQKNARSRQTWEAITQILNGCCLLFLSDLLVLLLVGCGLESLPRQTSPQEVHENVTQCLQVVSSGLFPAQMGVDAHVACSARQRFAFSVRNMLLGLGVTILLGHAKVDDVDNIGGLGAGAADEEVVRFDVAVY